MATFLFDKIIFGPVKSRRLGVSLGINLLDVESKICSFDCIYCECGWTQKGGNDKFKFYPASKIKEELDKKLNEMKAKGEDLDVITFAGNGEPTLHPEFNSIIDDTIELRNQYFNKAKIAVLTNSTMIHKSNVFEALNKVDDNIIKLDGGYIETIKLMNNPNTNFEIEKFIEIASKFDNPIIQTMFLKGTFKGEKVDNTSDDEIELWLNHVKRVNPTSVMIYTIARDTPAENLEKVSMEKLQEIGRRIEEAGFKVQISG